MSGGKRPGDSRRLAKTEVLVAAARRGTTITRVAGIAETDAFYELLAEEMPVDSILARHIDSGADAAAFITIRGSTVLAQVLVAEPRNSDLRQSSLVEKGETSDLGLGRRCFSGSRSFIRR